MLLLIGAGVTLWFVQTYGAPTSDCRNVGGFSTPPDGLVELVSAPVIVVGRQLPDIHVDMMDVTNTVRIDTVLKGRGVKPGDIIEMCPFAGPALPEEGQTDSVLLFLAGRDRGKWLPVYGSSGIAPGLSDSTYDIVEGFESKPASLDEVRKQIEAAKHRRD